jgi:hypothetical protein
MRRHRAAVAFAFFFLCAVLISGALNRIAGQSSPAASPKPLTIDQVNRWETDLSNWGRWGKEDERGTLNLVTPQKTREAARLVKDGITVSLARFAGVEQAADNFNFGSTKHELLRSPSGDFRALDTISYGIHDGTNSHLDALCHYAVTRGGQRLVFNGHPQDLGADGCKADGIDRMGPGIVTRGILVDLPLMKGVPYLEPGTAIYASDLEAWEKFAGVKISSGDALFIRTGRWARRAKIGAWNVGREAAGLHGSVMPWLKQRDVALLGSDAVNDVQPSGVTGQGEAANRPVHTLAIAVLGMPLVDNAYLEDAARESASRKRWEFMNTVQFTRLHGGTASNFNALATY